MEKALLLFCFATAVILPCGFAQTIILGLKFHTGSIIAHSKELTEISQSSPYGFQLEWSRFKTSDQAWQTCNCYGRTGLSFAYFNYDNPKQLGSAYNLSYFAEPYLFYKGPLKFSMRATVGLSYLTRVYDEEDNPENIFFSAPLSFLLQLGLAANYEVGAHGSFNLAYNFNHISNGGQKQPNKGMNFPTVSLGYDYFFRRAELQDKPASLKTYHPAIWSYVILLGSFRSSDPTATYSNHARTGISFGISKPLSRISNITAGVELTYDGAYREEIEEADLEESALITALLLGHQFSFGRVYFLTQMGMKLSRPRTVESRVFYQSYGLWYRLNRRLGLGSGLIAYGHIADHIDARLIWFMRRS
jgi:hypothetical protein